MYTENEILKLMQLREKRWELLRKNDDLSESQVRTKLNKVNTSLYKLTGKRQYL
jgi:hypothetical protein